MANIKPKKEKDSGKEVLNPDKGKGGKNLLQKLGNKEGGGGNGEKAKTEKRKRGGDRQVNHTRREKMGGSNS